MCKDNNLKHLLQGRHHTIIDLGQIYKFFFDVSERTNISKKKDSKLNKNIFKLITKNDAQTNFDKEELFFLFSNKFCLVSIVIYLCYFEHFFLSAINVW